MNGLKKLGWITATTTAVWGIDYYYNSSAFERNLRTLWYGTLIALDYKTNFEKDKAHEIDNLHSRCAQRIYHVCKSNGGLYIKFGQQVASVPVLPRAYAERFKDFFDNAPCVDYSKVKKLFREEFGKEIEDVFIQFTREPVASASIAQVHKATLKNGEIVAVKIQKPSIRQQMDWDLWNHRLVLWAFEQLFGLPVLWSASYIEGHLRQEVDFENEARNAEKCLSHIQESAHLRRYVHVPKVHWDVTSKRVMTAEWIEGTRFSDVPKLEQKGFSTRSIMTTLTNLFADQIFRTGHIHADPHVGNILIRDHPSRPRDYQIVLLDHGLYVQATDTFRHEYALFWKSLFTMDTTTLDKISRNWGIQDMQMFASGTLARPWKPGKLIHVQKVSMKDVYESQVDAKNKVKHFLRDTELLPKELIFIGRNLNIVRANNRALGSPVNRINLMANAAVQNLGSEWSVWGKSKKKDMSYMTSTMQFLQSRFSFLLFQMTLWAASVSFYTIQTFQAFQYTVFGIKSAGFEEVMDSAFKSALQEKMPGFVIDETVFQD